MNRDIPIWRRLAALSLLGTLPVLNGVIPVLDVMVGDGRPAVESHHIPGTHGYPHDHSICIQQHANRWAPSGGMPVAFASVAVTLPDLPTTRVTPPVRDLFQPRPRAPPVA